MVTWTGDGSIGGFVRVVDVYGVRPAIATYDIQGYKLASNGVVDLNAISRFQYEIVDYTDYYTIARLNISAADVSANPLRTFTASYFIAPASAVPAFPTVAQIIAAATDVARAQNNVDAGPVPYFRTSAGDILAGIFKPASQSWPPNTKLWIATVPTHVGSMSSTPSIANDLPLGNPNVTGRAVSMWTNRTPTAPVITSPSARTTAFAGQEVQFTFDPTDPDTIASFPGDTRPQDFDDVAGIQIQYAAVPTPDNPSPVWQDMPITATDMSGTLQRGWFIKSSITAPSNDGAQALWENYTFKIRCGSVFTTPGTGNLPAGNWQVRIRTFDFGHPFPSTTAPIFYPLNDDTRSYTPSTYPAANTSPWSTPVIISVATQVPPPIPLSPINDSAIPLPEAGDVVRLTWQYRNTFAPPYAQSARHVQLRRVGTPVWFEYIAVSPLNYINLSGMTLGHWEWRVKVTDAGGVESEYSSIARFWVVPQPASGEVRPLPSETIDGATLGCGTHRVEIYRRGGLTRVGQLDGISHVDWERKRDDISTAQIVLSGWSLDCGELLADLQTWAYEVVITRENGYSKDRVWEGPITLLTYETDRVTIEAKDVMAYCYRRIIRQAMSDTANGDTVTSRAARIIQNALAPDDPNILSYLQVLSTPDDAMQYRSTPAYSRTAFEEIDDMAANAGLDYAAIGRSILVWSTRHRIGTLPEFQDSDLGSPPIVSEYGMNMANVYVVSDGNGIYGEANRLDVSGNDPVYGRVEMLSSTWATDSEEETGTYTQEGINTMIESFEGFAERSIADRYPPPVIVRVPDNTTLNPGTVLSIQQLVPGVVIPLRSTGTLRNVIADQKLDSIKVIEEGGKETISITLSPFSYDEGSA